MKENREYVRTKKPSSFPFDIRLLKTLDDEFWKSWIFYYLLDFYQNYDSVELKMKIERENKQQHPRTEREIAKYIRIKLNAKKEFGCHFKAFGEPTNDENVEGNLDILIYSTNWENEGFCFECKNLNKSQDLINKYVYYNTYKKDKNNENIFDGGVYRYFNGKYAQKSNFGGMIGLVLDGDVLEIKSKILKKLEEKFNTTQEGNLVKIVDSSIEQNDFTFDSYHLRFNTEFILHHILFDFVS